MQGRSHHKNDDTGSGSDWDSMSEMDPIPKKAKKHIAGPPAVIRENISVPAQKKNKGKTSEHQKMERGQVDAEKPPYDFKNEAGNTMKSEANSIKPGKQRKGTIYDPQSPGSKKQVSFNQQSPKKDFNVSNDSDAEDPLYSTVKPKHARQQESNVEDSNANDESCGLGFRPKKMLPKLKIKSSQMQQKGMDNQGFIDDENYQVMENNGALDPNRKTLNNSPDTSEEIYTHDLSYINSSSPQKQLHLQQNNVPVENTSALNDWSPPLVLTSIDTTSFQSGELVIAVNQAVGQAFSLASFPFMCAAIFIHHLLRFLLLGIVKPFLVDSLTLMVELLLRPLALGVVRPLLLLVHTLSLTASDTCLVLLRPLVQVLKAFRLIEVNHTRRYSLEDV